MAEMRKRTSMSVLEMGRMLGLGKTESYWLIKKNYFKTILVGNTMRVMIDSFEEWYANQFKYQKVDGTPPGEELKKTTYSIPVGRECKSVTGVMIYNAELVHLHLRKVAE